MTIESTSLIIDKPFKNKDELLKGIHQSLWAIVTLFLQLDEKQLDALDNSLKKGFSDTLRELKAGRNNFFAGCGWSRIPELDHFQSIYGMLSDIQRGLTGLPSNILSEDADRNTTLSLKYEDEALALKQKSWNKFLAIVTGGLSMVSLLGFPFMTSLVGMLADHDGDPAIFGTLGAIIMFTWIVFFSSMLTLTGYAYSEYKEAESTKTVAVQLIEDDVDEVTEPKDQTNSNLNQNNYYLCSHGLFERGRQKVKNFFSICPPTDKNDSGQTLCNYHLNSVYKVGQEEKAVEEHLTDVKVSL